MTAASSPGSAVCQPCNINSHAVVAGSSHCQACPLEGVLCEGQAISVLAKYYAYNHVATKELRVRKCPQGYCEGTPMLSGEINRLHVEQGGTNTAIVQLRLQNPCSAHRLSSSLFCRECVKGFVQWDYDCVECLETKGGLLFLLIVASAAYVAIIHVLSQVPESAPANSAAAGVEAKEQQLSHPSSQLAARAAAGDSPGGSGAIGSLTYFVQVAQLQSLGFSTYIAWLGLAVLAPHAATGSTCITPLTPLQNQALPIIVPLFCSALLASALFVRFILAATLVKVRGEVPNGFLATCQLAWNRCDWSRYSRTAVALLLFAYQPIMRYCLTFFHCVEEEGESMLFLYPQVDCNSSQYRALLPLVIIIFTVILALPIAAFVWLYKQRLHLHRSLPLRSGWAGMLYDTYRSSCWLFSAFLLLMRLLFAVFDIYLTDVPSYRSMAFGLGNLLFLLGHIALQPMKTRTANSLQTLSSIALVVISLLQTASASAVGTEQNKAGGEAQVPLAIGVTVTIIVIGPATLYAVLILQELSKQLTAKRKALQALSQRIATGVCCCRRTNSPAASIVSFPSSSSSSASGVDASQAKIEMGTIPSESESDVSVPDAIGLQLQLSPLHTSGMQDSANGSEDADVPPPPPLPEDISSSEQE
jgi:hypothetical protein